ncbi:MAG: hypothetical protein M0P70_02870 [Desulfobulbaceae bacterium]|nr:hypothetical protein [Desulfobulbaceae bacterium]
MSTAFIMAMNYLQQYRLAGNEPFFYQEMFEPAVMMACGHDFGVEKERTSEALTQFLKLERQSFNCADLPNSPDLMTSTSHGAWLYMLSASAFVWKFSGGINWATLDVLPSIFFALSIASIYGLFRLAGGLISASFGVIAVLVSNQYLTYLPFLRDYSKAPFILLAMLLLMWLVAKTQSFRAQIVLSLLMGIVIGIGYGFRPDILIMLPPVVIGIVIFIRSMRLSDLWRKMSLVAIVMSAFIISALAILNSAKESGSGIYHFPILGFGTEFTRQMGVVGSLYEWVYQFNDQLVYAMVTSHGIRNFGVKSVGYCTPDYDKFSGDLYQSLVMTFPADMMTRATASVLQVLHTFNFSCLVVFASLFFLVAARPRIGLFSGFLVFYLAGYPAIQFHPRHFFHLYFIPIMAAIFLLQQAYDHRSGILRMLRLEPCSWRKALQAAGKAGLIFLAVGGGATVLVMIARQYQVRQVSQLIESYASDDVWHNMSMVHNSEHPEMLSFPITISDDQGEGTAREGVLMDSAMIRLRFNNFHCLSENNSVTVSYSYSAPYVNFTHSIDLMPFVTTDESLEVYIPIYRDSAHTRSGLPYYFEPQRVEVPAEMLQCSDGIEAAVGRPKQRLWLEFVLPQDWRKHPLYQQIGEPPLPPGKPYLRYPDDLSLSFQQAKALLANLEPAAGQQLESLANIVSVVEGEIVVDGKAHTPYSYLFQLPAEKLVSPRVFLIEGELFKGGLTVGMIKDDLWASQINITGYGKFLVAIEHSQGLYIPTIANNVPSHPSNHFVIRRMGWLDSSRYQSKAVHEN